MSGFLLVAHLVGAQLGDFSLNPARSLGPAVLCGQMAMTMLWAFIVSPLLGGVLGWRQYQLLND